VYNFYPYYLSFIPMLQEKKMELLDALFKMEHGGDPNALLQVPFTLSVNVNFGSLL